MWTNQQLDLLHSRLKYLSFYKARLNNYIQILQQYLEESRFYNE